MVTKKEINGLLKFGFYMVWVIPFLLINTVYWILSSENYFNNKFVEIVEEKIDSIFDDDKPRPRPHTRSVWKKPLEVSSHSSQG